MAPLIGGMGRQVHVATCSSLLPLYRCWPRPQRRPRNAEIAVHPDQPFDHAQKAYWLQRDAALKAFVDRWMKQTVDDGSFARIYATWFE
jgi:hypothetical protein